MINLIPSKVYWNVELNKKQTKYVMDGQEVDRVSEHKGVMGNVWSKWNIAVYKGRETTFSLLQENRDYLDAGYDAFKKLFNAQEKKKKEDALNKGIDLHQEINDIILNASDKDNLIKALKESQNPFAALLLENLVDGWEVLFCEKSFICTDMTDEQGICSFGGTIDLVLIKRYPKYKGAEVFQLKIIDWKTAGKTKEERYDDLYVEYGQQLACYREALKIEYPQCEILCELAFEDGEIFCFTDIVLENLFLHFLFNKQMSIRTAHSLQIIKELRESYGRF